MGETLFDHERKLEMEMLDAAQHVADVAHVEKDPLLIILWRLNHQDRTLESIKGEVKGVTTLVSDHISRENEIKESIDSMVALWKGSKVVARIVMGLAGIIVGIAGAYAAVKKGLFT